LFNPVLGVIGAVLGLLGGAVLGFTPVDYFEFIGISIVGGIIVMIMGRGK